MSRLWDGLGDKFVVFSSVWIIFFPSAFVRSYRIRSSWSFCFLSVRILFLLRSFSQVVLLAFSSLCLFVVYFGAFFVFSFYFVSMFDISLAVLPIQASSPSNDFPRSFISL